jgi:beta-phosphoglucomutase-like phosphatase (HAD superfamily)
MSTPSPPGFAGAIFDVDGVLVDSPHEHAWRQALHELMDGPWRDIRDATGWRPEAFSSVVYGRLLAGRPRMSGARAALAHFGVPVNDANVDAYAARKQAMVVELIEAGQFTEYPDAVRFALAVKASGILLAAASSSANADMLLERIRVDAFAAKYDFVSFGSTLLSVLDGDVSGRRFARGKPDPEIFLAAARELGVPPRRCVVIEDAIAGIQAARTGGMGAVAVARAGDEQALAEAGADLVVTSLDDVDVASLVRGRLVRTAGGRA